MTQTLTRLAKAILHSKGELVREYLSQGDSADVEVTQEGLTGLMFASYWGDLEVVKLLLSNGANPNHPLKDGTTALMKAVVQNDVPIVLELLHAGAQADLKDDRGWDALSYATNKGLDEMALIIKQSNPSIERDKKLAELLFGGVRYNEVATFCNGNFGLDFSKNLLLLILSEVVFGSPSVVEGNEIYQVEMNVHQWEQDPKIPVDIQLSQGIMSFIGSSQERINEISSNRFRLENYGFVFMELATQWLNESITLGSGSFSMAHEGGVVWLTYSIPKNEIHTLDFIKHELGRFPK